MRRRGFSVFTPMVGTIVIMITMLIVSSIVASERIAVQGSVKSYRSSELVGIAAEAQSRVVEEVRSAVTSRLEGYSIQGEPVMSVVVSDCPGAWDGGFYMDDLGTLCNGAECPCGVYNVDMIAPCDRASRCLGNAYNQVNLTAVNELSSKALLETSIAHTIEGIVDKYALITVTATDVEFTDIVKSVSFLDCEPDFENVDFWDCKDGRLNVKIDFAPIAGQAVAEVRSEGKRLDVFMPAGEVEYSTREPYMQYALLTSKLFSDFRLLNNSWHGAGGDFGEHGDALYDETNGEEWYHYNYAYQERYYGTVGRNDFASAWSHGFNVTSTESEAVYDFNNGVTLREYIVDELLGGNTLPTPARSGIDFSQWALFGYPDWMEWERVQNLRLDDDIGGLHWEHLLPFVSGYASKTEEIGLPGFGIEMSIRQDNPFQGGCADPDPLQCSRQSGPQNCLPNDPNFAGEEPYSGSTVLVNNTEAYDERFLSPDGMKALVEAMAENIRDSPYSLPQGMGITESANLHYNLTVESKQFYVEGNGFKGGDNFHCGQFLALYLSDSADSGEVAVGESGTCEATRRIFGGTPVCGLGASPFCNFLCPGGAWGKCAWFLSEPVNWTCDTWTLYRVEEIYRLYRSTPDSEEPTRPVFAARYTRIKDSPSALANSEHNSTLWTYMPQYSDIESGDGVYNATERDVNNVRRCTYSYSTFGSAKTASCEWVRSDQLA